MKNLFAYGTLMCEDIMVEVSGCHLSQVPGTLKGYRRRSVIGEPYPAIVLEKEGRVEGVIYRDVPVAAWERLDLFEGEMYARQVVLVEQDDGSRLFAETYVIKAAFQDRLDQSDWDFDHFVAVGKASFQRQYKGYRLL